MIDIDRDQVFSVSEINRHLKHVIESNIPAVFVEGEVANFVRHGSGHLYFSLKDTDATLRCVFFKPGALYIDFSPADGDRVICAGHLSVYEKGGTYQLTVSHMVLSGYGAQQAKLEALKKQLNAEGLFDMDRKRPIPAFPRRIGVITSPTGAAFRDIQNVISRRWPCEIVLYPVRVQGEGAAREILAGLERFRRQPDADVLIIGRGGGSQEDLFVFNDEAIARAVAMMPMPVISAVGHEIDYTLIDFVADLRAPTPSAAAELAVPDRDEVLRLLNGIANRIGSLLYKWIRERSLRLSRLETALTRAHPRSRLRELRQRLDEATDRFQDAMGAVDDRRDDLGRLENRLRAVLQLARFRDMRRSELTQLSHRLETAVRVRLDHTREQVAQARAQLDIYSPRDALSRGFALARVEHRLLRSVQDAYPGMTLDLLLKDGICSCSVVSVDDTPPC
jgi:exodeoxyribonuclease VII large subunit